MRSFSELAKNEIRAHEKVQRSEGCANICLLLGTYEGRIGEQWLVFDSSSIYPVSYWAELASKKGLNKQNWSLLNLLDPGTTFLFSLVLEESFASVLTNCFFPFFSSSSLSLSLSLSLHPPPRTHKKKQRLTSTAGKRSYSRSSKGQSRAWQGCTSWTSFTPTSLQIQSSYRRWMRSKDQACK